ncbi:MAG: lipopolysaccharide biosynthesis protein [Geobacter sp.]|nr:lipopolysaccharide biosynthesis protein [Geobacter sp.]
MLPPPIDRSSSSFTNTYENDLCNNERKVDSLDLFVLVEGILNNRIFIFKFTCFAAFISIVFTLFLDNSYRSTAIILPPQQDSGLMGMLLGSSGGNLASLAGDIIGKGTPADMYVGILNSEEINDKIINRFKLMERYDEKYRISTHKVLKKNTEMAVGKKDGLITITVDDKNPKLAADMANAYVEELGNLIVRLNTTDSLNNKVFYKQRLTKAKADLSTAENELKTFQLKNKILSITEQAQTTIVGLAQLKAQIALQEVQLATLQQQFTNSSHEVKSAKSSINNLYKQVAQLEGNGSISAIPSVGRVPVLGQQYLRLMREFKVQETLVELLTKSYEIESLNSEKNVNSLQVVQAARAPDKKNWPKRTFIVATITTVAFIISIIVTLFILVFDTIPKDVQNKWRQLMKNHKFSHN